MLRMQRPAWLRWQKIQLSPWLVAAMLVTGLVPVGYLVGRDWLRLISGSPEELERFIREITYAPSPALIVYALVAQGLLLWFTYFSGSARVRQSEVRGVPDANRVCDWMGTDDTSLGGSLVAERLRKF